MDDLREIHDIAIAAEAYAKAHRLGLDAENHAMEIRLLAARRIGELVPAEKPGPKPDNSAEARQISEVPHQRLSEFRKLAEIPMPEFKERIEVAKAREEKITYNKLLRGDWYQTSDSPEWETPQWLFDILNAEFSFNLDVCASPDNAKCQTYFSKSKDGLLQSWVPHKCWMNPPYGRDIADWMMKATKEAQKGALIVCLVPARTDTDWWWENCIKGEIRFIHGRLQFAGSNMAAPFPSAVVILNKDIVSKVIWWNVQAKR